MVRQRVRGLIVGTVTGIALGTFVFFLLHAIPLACVAIGGVVGVSVFAVVATKTGPEDEAADAAWQEAAMDLPPVSDRVILERMQANMPGPLDRRRGAKPASTGKNRTGTLPASSPTDKIDRSTGSRPAPSPVNPNVPSEMERP